MGPAARAGARLGSRAFLAELRAGAVLVLAEGAGHGLTLRTTSRAGDEDSAIRDVLRERLGLALRRDGDAPFPVSRGIDFVGWGAWWSHRVPRGRTLGSVETRLDAFERRHWRAGRCGARGRSRSPARAERAVDHLRTSLASSAGHLQHARAWRKLGENVGATSVAECALRTRRVAIGGALVTVFAISAASVRGAIPAARGPRRQRHARLLPGGSLRRVLRAAAAGRVADAPAPAHLPCPRGLRVRRGVPAASPGSISAAPSTRGSRSSWSPRVPARKAVRVGGDGPCGSSWRRERVPPVGRHAASIATLYLNPAASSSPWMARRTKTDSG